MKPSDLSESQRERLLLLGDSHNGPVIHVKDAMHGQLVKLQMLYVRGDGSYSLTNMAKAIYAQLGGI